jgi:hypothetical protein
MGALCGRKREALSQFGARDGQGGRRPWRAHGGLPERVRRGVVTSTRQRRFTSNHPQPLELQQTTRRPRLIHSHPSLIDTKITLRYLSPAQARNFRPSNAFRGKSCTQSFCATTTQSGPTASPSCYKPFLSAKRGRKSWTILSSGPPFPSAPANASCTIYALVWTCALCRQHLEAYPTMVCYWRIFLVSEPLPNPTQLVS